jgi:DNA-binding NarL/FixJ family response regulator
MMQNLLIVDDHQMFAEGIKFLIEHSTDYHVAGVLHNGADVVPFLAKKRVHLLLLDIDLPDMSGFDVVKTIRQVYPQTKVLALSMHADTYSISRMIDMGAAGYCIKSEGRDELFRAIQQVCAGENYLPAGYLKQNGEAGNELETPELTGRETEIIQLIAEGITTKNIADQLFLSARTVETHRKIFTGNWGFIPMWS